MGIISLSLKSNDRAFRTVKSTILNMAYVAISFTLMTKSAVAQFTNESSTVTLTPSDISLNIENCETLAAEQSFTLNGTYTGSPNSTTYETRLIAGTAPSCSVEDSCTSIEIDEDACTCEDYESNQLSITHSFTLAELFDQPCVEGSERTVNFYLHYKESNVDFGTPVEHQSTEVLQIVIDLAAPEAPEESPSVTPAEEALVINAPEVSGDIGRYEACVWLPSDDRETARCKEITPDSSDRFEGLQNDVVYQVIYAVYDTAGNRSEDSPAVEGTPASVLDFAEVYSGEYPGGERGGCQSMSDDGAMNRLPLVCLFLGLMVFVRSRKRSRGYITLLRVSILNIAIVGLTPQYGIAKPSSSFSPMTSTVTLSGGAYQPSIDDEFIPRDGVQRPYARVFQDQSPVMFQVQLERHLLDSYGLLSIGGILGYWNVEGDGLSVTNVTETTEMSVIPFAVYAGYRFDLFQDLIPLVPSLKLGVNYYTWSIYDGSGDIASFVDGSEASGGTFGWFYSIGVNLLLDFLDREMAWSFDRDAGVNHSYLTFEYQVSTVNDFGDPDSFRLGSEMMLFGITLDI